MITRFDFNSHYKFDKEKKKFIRKCPSIKTDFERFKQALTTDIRHNDYNVPVDNKKYSQVQGLADHVYLPAFVVKRFYCEKMNKGSASGFRIVFVYDKAQRFIYFTEMYFKGKKKVEDKERINRLFLNKFPE